MGRFHGNDALASKVRTSDMGTVLRAYLTGPCINNFLQLLAGIPNDHRVEWLAAPHSINQLSKHCSPSTITSRVAFESSLRRMSSPRYFISKSLALVVHLCAQRTSAMSVELSLSALGFRISLK